MSSTEIDRVHALAKDEQETGEQSEEEGGDAVHDDDDLPPELMMDKYDDEEGLDGLLVADNEDDDDGDDGMFLGEDNVLLDEEDDEDKEDDAILASDTVLALAMTEDEHSHLEIQVLSAEGSLYTHHDILLPDFPLCLAWMDCPPFTTNGQQNDLGSFMAVGTFAPAIEIWNLDVLDAIEPTATLGGMETRRKGGKLKKSKHTFLPGSHTEAVMTLSWNAVFRQALASGSADCSVKVWDVTSQVCSHTFLHHADKVQSVLWHPKEAWLLASAAFDKSLGLVDCRSAGTAKLCTLTADPECVAWNPFNPYQLFCSLESGDVLCVDIRAATSNSAAAKGKSSPVLSAFRAHDKAVSSLQFSAQVDGLLATASVDKTVKVWDTHSLLDAGDAGPQCVAYKTMNVGKLLAMQFNADDPFLLAAAGDKGMVAIWESDENEHIRSHFAGRVVQKASRYTGIGVDEVQTGDGEIIGIVRTEGAEQEQYPEDEWMDDNEGITSAPPKPKKTKSKKKK